MVSRLFGSQQLTCMIRSMSSSSTASTKASKEQLLQSIAREAHATEVVASSWLQMQSTVLHGRPDAQLFAEQAGDGVRAAEGLVVGQAARPSLLLGVLRLGGAALGAVSGVAPKRVRYAIAGGMQDALTERYTQQLRQLQEAGLAKEATNVREVLRQLRDVERAPEGAPAAPDLVSLSQQGGKMALEEVVAGGVKAVCLAAAQLASKV